jgi:hypothetical protein
MGTAGVDVAFMISLMELSYAEEEQMRKDAAKEAEQRNIQQAKTDKTVKLGDAKKGASLFKVCQNLSWTRDRSPAKHLPDALRTMPHYSRRPE